MSKDILKVSFYSRHARYINNETKITFYISFQVEVIYN